MILTQRLFEREPPNRDAKSIFIFSEGAKREYKYFMYFKEMDSRINIEVYKLHPHEDNSPLGLFSIAEKCLISSANNPSPKYEFIEGDEVWIVLDTDKDKDESRAPQITQIREKCANKKNWSLAQSNPCFEVWLYYHMQSETPSFTGDDVCKAWKKFVNKEIKGGFDPRKQSVFIGKAIKNSEINYQEENSSPKKGSTQIHNLAKSIYIVVEEKINHILEELVE